MFVIVIAIVQKETKKTIVVLVASCQPNWHLCADLKVWKVKAKLKPKLLSIEYQYQKQKWKQSKTQNFMRKIHKPIFFQRLIFFCVLFLLCVVYVSVSVCVIILWIFHKLHFSPYTAKRESRNGCFFPEMFYLCPLMPLNDNQNQNRIVLYAINSKIVQTCDSTLNLFCAQLVNIWKGLQNSPPLLRFLWSYEEFQIVSLPRNPAMAGNGMGFVTQNILQNFFVNFLLHKNGHSQFPSA